MIWNDNDEPDMMACGVDSKSVGRYISTKKIGVTEREIITDNYKEKEGVFNTSYTHKNITILNEILT